MKINPLIDALQQNRHMRSRAEVLAFDNALQALAPTQTADDLPRLLAVFTDDCQHPEVMDGLVHCVESFDLNQYLAALIQAVPSMRIQAPEWTNTLHYRILNDGASSATYKKLLQSASASAKQAVNGVLSKIQQGDPEFSTAIGDLFS